MEKIVMYFAVGDAAKAYEEDGFDAMIAEIEEGYNVSIKRMESDNENVWRSKDAVIPRIVKTKKLYAVEVIDHTCTVLGHETGIYGKGDYSWVTESLNGGEEAEYDMTAEEAIEVMEDFQRIIKEKNLEWASVRIDHIDVENDDELSYDIVFQSDDSSNSKGFNSSFEYCKDYIRTYNSTDESYFSDYKGGTVQIVCNETEEVVYEEEVR